MIVPGITAARRVLLVEDDPLIGPLLIELLAVMGHQVCALESTEDGAVAAAARHQPDLMIVDMHLPAGTGAGAVERISRSGPVPHVLISGDPRQALPPGVQLLRKPFSESELRRAIQLALGTVEAAAG